MIDHALAALRRGWLLTPLNGKKPILDAWQRAPAPTEDQLREWLAAGRNLGLRTGAASGVLVLDEDTPKGACLEPLWAELGIEEPVTPTVRTGGGGRHLYFRAPTPCPGNSASKLAPHIDTRGEGGQVVFVGSVHPTTGQVYEWETGRSPDDVPLADIPAGVLAVLLPPQRTPHAATNSGNGYAAAALTREIAAVATAPVTTRNDTLNRAAFNLGQLVAGNALSEHEVVSGLSAAARGLAADDGSASVAATIRSGLAAGMAQPRSAPERPSRGGRPALRIVQPDETTIVETRPEMPCVLLPGAHIDSDGEYHEQGTDDFCRGVLEALPPGTLYRRDWIPGEIIDGKFRDVSVPRVKYLIDEHVRVVRWVRRKTDAGPVRVYQACPREQAVDVLDAAGRSAAIPVLRLIVDYPVCIGRDFTFAAPGWNADDGVYYHEPESLRGLAADYSVERIRAVLDDLTVDFPWRGDGIGASSRENAYGLLLTPMVRPALHGNTPLHLLLAPIPRAGKTKIAEDIIGGVYLDGPTPALQLGGNEEEREKRITAMLVGGSTIIHVDNLREYLDSASLASLLTSAVWSGRYLGASKLVHVPNTVTLIASGNNVRASTELVKRTVPVWLAPPNDEPEARTDFRHPDLRAYVSEQRRPILEALRSMVARWRDGARELSGLAKGGFDRWSSVVGGILGTSGYVAWRTNERGWARAADPDGEDLRAFLSEWAERYGTEAVQAKVLLEIVDALDVFPDVAKQRTETGRLMSLVRRVLVRHLGSPVTTSDGRTVTPRSVKRGNQNNYRLEIAD